MSTCVYTMSGAHVEDGLLLRLERLTGDATPGCVPHYQQRAQSIREARAFQAALTRMRALADEGRLLALEMLRGSSGLCACEIQAALGLTHATVSHHMQRLVAAGLVGSRREGKWLYYSLTDAGRRFRP